jgi:hypothetical protein
MSPIDAELRHLAAPPLPGRDGAASPPDQPDPHEQAEDYELQLPYQGTASYPLGKNLTRAESAGRMRKLPGSRPEVDDQA